MPRSAGGGVDQVKIQQPAVKESPHRIQVTDGGDATDGKAGLGADECCICLAQGFARKRACLCALYPLAASRDK